MASRTNVDQSTHVTQQTYYNCNMGHSAATKLAALAGDKAAKRHAEVLFENMYGDAARAYQAKYGIVKGGRRGGL
jgi:hypothetical protein